MYFPNAAHSVYCCQRVLLTWMHLFPSNCDVRLHRCLLPPVWVPTLVFHRRIPSISLTKAIHEINIGRLLISIICPAVWFLCYYYFAIGSNQPQGNAARTPTRNIMKDQPKGHTRTLEVCNAVTLKRWQIGQLFIPILRPTLPPSRHKMRPSDSLYRLLPSDLLRNAELYFSWCVSTYSVILAWNTKLRLCD
jgi:hypothetical protein